MEYVVMYYVPLLDTMYGVVRMMIAFMIQRSRYELWTNLASGNAGATELLVGGVIYWAIEWHSSMVHGGLASDGFGKLWLLRSS